MKKYVTLIVSVLLFGLCGCEQFQIQPSETPIRQIERLETEGQYPFYQSLPEEEKAIYNRICVAIEEHDTSEIELGTYDSEEACKAAEDRLAEIYRYLVYEQPEYIWMDISQHEAITWTQGDEYRLGIQLTYLMDENESKEKTAELDKRVDEIVQEAQLQEGIFDQVLYVHDEILKYAVYDDELAENSDTDDIRRSAYGCLVDGETVCSGYALAFNMIMQELGYECGVEFDVEQLNNISGGHVWNYAKLEDEYYFFDLTWDDTIFDTEDYRSYTDYAYQYFGITTFDSPYIFSEKSIAPECEGRKYNYYIYNGWNVETYNFEAVKEMILEQRDRHCIGLRFEDYLDVLTAEQELCKDGRIFEILPDVDEVQYLVSDSNQHLYLFYE